MLPQANLKQRHSIPLKETRGNEIIIQISAAATLEEHKEMIASLEIPSPACTL
jgi:hypothetical protein